MGENYLYLEFLTGAKITVFDQTSSSVTSLNNTYLTVSDRKQQLKAPSGIISEKVAILTCSLPIAVFAVIALVLIQALSAVIWGSLTIWQLLNGKGLFREGDEL